MRTYVNNKTQIFAAGPEFTTLQGALTIRPILAVRRQVLDAGTGALRPVRDAAALLIVLAEGEARMKKTKGYSSVMTLETMRGLFQVAAAMAVIWGLAVTAFAQEKAKKAPNDAVIAAALENAMTPGPGQMKLEFMVGTFDVEIRTWASPSEFSVRRQGGHGRQLGARRTLHPVDAGGNRHR
jgi:hypothetical protein